MAGIFDASQRSPNVNGFSPWRGYLGVSTLPYVSDEDLLGSEEKQPLKLRVIAAVHIDLMGSTLSILTHVP